MRFCVLGSGSGGNSTLVECGGTTLLIDAGFSGVEITRRLNKIGRRPEQLSAILVTHEHNDHVSGVGIMSRRCGLPVYANGATHEAASSRVRKLAAYREFTTGEGFAVGKLAIHPFAISHDTADPVGFTISDGSSVFGYCTDTGKVTQLMRHHLGRCHGLVLEANHDPQMLRDGPYPLPLKQRVGSGQGHLANPDTARLIRDLQGDRLAHVVLAHLSDTNNAPELAFRAVRNGLDPQRRLPEISLARQDGPGVVVELGKR